MNKDLENFEIQKLRRTINELQQKNKELGNQTELLEQVQYQYNLLKEDQQNLENEYSSKNEENQRVICQLRSQLEFLSDKFSKEESKTKEKQNQIKAIENEWQKSVQQNNILQEKCQQQEIRIQELEQNQMICTKQNQQQDQSKQEIEEENQKYKIFVEELQNQIQSLNEQNENLKNQLKSKQKENLVFKLENQKQTQKIQNLKAYYNETKELCQQYINEKQKIEKENYDQQNELKQIQQHKNQYENQIKKLNKNINDQSLKINKLEENEKQFKEKFQQLSKENDELNSLKIKLEKSNNKNKINIEMQSEKLKVNQFNQQEIKESAKNIQAKTSDSILCIDNILQTLEQNKELEILIKETCNKTVQDLSLIQFFNYIFVSFQIQFMKNSLQIFFIIFINVQTTLIDFSPKVKLHKGRVLTLEEGYNEKLENQNFLNRLDKIDAQLDQLQDNLNHTRVETFKQIDDLTNKMTSDRNIDILSNFFQRQIAQKKFDQTIKKINESRIDKLKRAVEIRDKLKKLYEDKKNQSNQQVDQSKKQQESKIKIIKNRKRQKESIFQNITKNVIQII